MKRILAVLAVLAILAGAFLMPAQGVQAAPGMKVSIVTTYTHSLTPGQDFFIWATVTQGKQPVPGVVVHKYAYQLDAAWTNWNTAITDENGMVFFTLHVGQSTGWWWVRIYLYPLDGGACDLVRYQVRIPRGGKQ